MGVFSWDCRVCGHPMLAFDVVNDINGWMNDVVVLLSDGSMHMGSYDGYGRVGGADIQMHSSNEPECYHKHCWELADKPLKFTGSSRSSNDQGYFFGDEHDIEPPKTKPEKPADPTPHSVLGQR